MSSATFQFRFEGSGAEQDANAMFEELPDNGSLKEITKRVIKGKTIWFVNAEFDMHADDEYVRQVADAISKFKVRED